MPSRGGDQEDRLEPSGSTPAAMRQCGECQACCWGVPIVEGLHQADGTRERAYLWEKPAGQKCEKLSMFGCGDYAERPPSCRNFRCMWLEGQFSDQDRPDHSGAILWHSASGLRFAEAYPGGLDNPRGQELIKQFGDLIRPVTSETLPFWLQGAEEVSYDEYKQKRLKVLLD